MGIGAALSAQAAPQTFYPTKDGTLADGGGFGPFDGAADDADWYFNQSSYEGSISRSVSTPQSSTEHRVVWEYNLATVTLTPPVSATLFVTIRGAPVYPRPNAPVHVYAYAADLQETLGDFSIAPIGLMGVIEVPPYSAPTVYTVDVSSAVGFVLASGAKKIGIRFQIDPQSGSVADQAYIDALDSDATTKPRLVVDEAPPVPGDIDGDGDADLDDFAGLPACMDGPNVAVGGACEAYDLDADSDVDMDDYGIFQTYFNPSGP